KVAPTTDMQFIYRVYFYSWLILSLYYIARHNLRRTNTETLLLGSILGLLVPVANGIYDGNWPWRTFANNQLDILFVDVFWIVLSIISFICYLKIRKADKKKPLQKTEEKPQPGNSGGPPPKAR